MAEPQTLLALDHRYFKLRGADGDTYQWRTLADALPATRIVMSAAVARVEAHSVVRAIVAARASQREDGRDFMVQCSRG